MCKLKVHEVFLWLLLTCILFFIIYVIFNCVLWLDVKLAIKTTTTKQTCKIITGESEGKNMKLNKG